MLRLIPAGAALAVVCGTTQAGSILATIEHAVEVPLPAFELPANRAGVVEFAVCARCERRSAAISDPTTFLVNNRAATFEAFAAALRAARGAADVADRSLVGLYFDSASQRLVRIALIASLPQ